MVQSLPRSIRLFFAVLATLTAACGLTELACAFLLHLPLPYSWPLTPIDEFGYDLNGFAPKFQYFHSPRFFSIEPQYAFAYPAPMAVLYRLIYWVPNPREIDFAIVAGLALAGFCVVLARKLIGRGIRPAQAWSGAAALLVLSYPFAFLIKQGNLEFFVWLLVAGGIWLFLRGRGYSSAACFALAGSLKIFPLIFLGLHLAQRRWRPIVFALLLLPVVEVVSLWLLVPDIAFAYRHLQDAIALLQAKIILQVLPREIGFDHSLFSVVKRLWLAAGTQASLHTVLQGYLGVTATAGTLLMFLRIRYLPVTNQVLALVVASILLPPVSYDYTLIHLYLPVGLLFLKAVEAQPRGSSLPGLTAALVLLAACIAPLSELIFHHVQFGGQVRALLLLCLFCVALLHPFRADQTAKESQMPKQKQIPAG